MMKSLRIRLARWIAPELESEARSAAFAEVLRTSRRDPLACLTHKGKYENSRKFFEQALKDHCADAGA